MRVDPARTTSLGKPVGRDSSLKSWEGDQWKTGGACAWGWFAYDPAPRPRLLRHRQSLDLEPAQRPGDNRWATSIVARDPDTGMARWLYQMTPHDEWDYDGVNEMILTDQAIGGVTRPLLTHFDRNGFGYTLDRATGELLVAQKFDRAVNWATRVDLDRASPGYGRPVRDPRYSPGSHRRGRDHHGHLPRRHRGQEPAAGGLLAAHPAVLRADQPHLHGLRAVPGQLHPRPALCGRHREPAPGPRRSPHRHPDRLGRGRGRDPLVDPRAVLGLVRGARHRRGRGVLRHPGGLPEGRRRALGRELYRFKTPSGIVGNVTTYRHRGRQYVAVLSGVGGWAGIGLAAGLTDPNDGAGAVGGYAALSRYTALGGQLTVFALPE